MCLFTHCQEVDEKIHTTRACPLNVKQEEDIMKTGNMEES